MILNEKKGNLFELDDKYVLAHCISEDCAMGAGIAVEFQKKFKGMKGYLLETIEQVPKEYPCTILYPFGKQQVFNLITKKKYWHKPTYDSIEKCIHQMRDICKSSNIKYLAIPKIGCGLDRLQWGKIREIIKEEFKDLDIEIEVRYLC